MTTKNLQDQLILQRKKLGFIALKVCGMMR